MTKFEQDTYLFQFGAPTKPLVTVAVVPEEIMIEFIPELPEELGRYTNFPFDGDHVGLLPAVMNVGVEDADAV